MQQKDKRTGRITTALIILFVLMLVLVVLNISIGSYSIPADKIISVFRDGPTAEAGSLISTMYAILHQIRLPRLLACLILGGALGLAGFLLQTFFGNPIAGPFVLGISSGAKLTVALTMVFAAATVLAEENAFTFRNGITFGLNMDQVMATETGRYEIDSEHTRGPVTFDELEYEHVSVNDKPADLTYLFVGNELVAIRIDLEEYAATFDQVKADLTAKYGESAPVDLARLGNGIYAVDDDGRFEGRAEAIISGNVMIIIEADEEDVNVIYVDLNAAYINV